jgi:1-acyl-sn-glycerol-3-phosphate acyltransferase
MLTLVFQASGAARRLWALVVWGLAIRIWCRRLRISGLRNLPNEPVVVVANHSSHADTVLLQYALAIRHRLPVLVAGAEDYWFRNRVLSAAAKLLGVFAFPRRGEVGVRRARKAIRRRSTVIMYPQGSRNGGQFRAGIGRIAVGNSVCVVPVYISGSDVILPRGRRWPHRGDVIITFGRATKIEPNETPSEFAMRIEAAVLDHRELAA